MDKITFLLVASILLIFMPITGFSAIEWPRFGPERDVPELSGHTNAVPDAVGPIDGSARLTIFTEGNHFPALLPVVLDEFPAWSRENQGPRINAEEILIVTLPQGMIVDMLLRGGLRMGNAVLSVGLTQPVFPDIVMAGPQALKKLAEAQVVGDDYMVFTRHKGMGLLLNRKAELDGLSLAQLVARQPRVVLATADEPGARAQYRQTLEMLVGEAQMNVLLEKEVVDFPGRLAIQHRDVPYALLQNLADVGLIFGHLARFYAEAFPEQLTWTELPQAEPFGRDIAMAKSVVADSPEREAFLRFFPEAARSGYPPRGFAELE